MVIIRLTMSHKVKNIFQNYQIPTLYHRTAEPFFNRPLYISRKNVTFVFTFSLLRGIRVMCKIC